MLKASALAALLAMSTNVSAALGKRQFMPGWNAPTPMPVDTTVTLINATPYRWRRGHIHSYQMEDWDMWPEVINPGEARSMLITGHRGLGTPGDTAGEVEYCLEGTKVKMGFDISYDVRNMNHFDLRAHFRGKLESDTTHRRGYIDLGETPSPGGSSFILAGMEGSFISSAHWGRGTSKPGWMQELLPELGDLPLREIAMLRSHHAGLNHDNRKLIGASMDANTVTQIHPLKHQMEVEGVRILDIRAMKYKNQLVENHGDIHLGVWHGAVGAKISEIVRDVNAFNAAHPGELMILDFHQDTFSDERRYKDLDPDDRKELYRELKKLKHRVKLSAPKDKDITKQPLKNFIGKEIPGVIIRFSNNWKAATPDSFPGLDQGFVTHENFPIHSYWSEKYSEGAMAQDQIHKLLTFRQSRKGQIFDAHWIRSLPEIKNILPPNNWGLVELGRHTMVLFRQWLWNHLTDTTYANWVTLDSIDGGEMKVMMMVMNRCFVLRECGDWVRTTRPAPLKHTIGDDD